MKLLFLLLLVLLILNINAEVNKEKNDDGSIGYLLLTDNLDMDVEAIMSMHHMNKLDLMIVTGKGYKASQVAASILQLSDKPQPAIYSAQQPATLDNNFLVSILQGFANAAYFTPGLSAPKVPPGSESEIEQAYVNLLTKFQTIKVVSIAEASLLTSFLKVVKKYQYNGEVIVSSMFGSIVGGTHRGNVNIFTANQNTEAEYNVWADPVVAQEALELCTELGVKLYVYSLESTDNFPVTNSFLEKLAKIDSSALFKFYGQYATNAHNLYNAVSINLYHWDVLSVYSLLDIINVQFDPVKISIKTSGANAGATYIDNSENGHLIYVANPYTISTLQLEDKIIEVFSQNYNNDLRTNM